MTKFQIIDSSDPYKWDALVEQFSGCTLFHTSYWCKVIERTYGINGFLIKILEKEHVIGVIPVWLTKKLGLTLAGSPLRQTGTHFCGPLLKDRIDLWDILEKLYHFLTKEFKVTYFDLTLPYPLSTGSLPAWKITKPDTLVLNLNRSEEEIWKSFEGRMRTAVRKAKKSGVQIELICSTIKEIEIFYDMLKKVYARWGVKPIFPKEFYKNVLIPQTPYAFLYGARIEGCWIAMALILKYRDWMNYHSAASLREFKKYNSNNLLQWQIILDGLKEGRKMYDLGGGSGIGGIEKFKMSLRPSKHQYTNLWRATWIGRLARKGYEKIYPFLRKGIKIPLKSLRSQ